MTKRTRKLLHSSVRDNWNTPRWFAELLWSFADVALDPCSNRTAIVGAYKECRANDHEPGTFYDGMHQRWRKMVGRGLVFVNPPYGRGAIEEWIAKCDEEAARGVEIVALVPSRTDTRWYQENHRVADVEVRGRLTFEGAPHPAPFPSSVFYWGPRPEQFAEAFGPLGRLHIVAAAAQRPAPAPAPAAAPALGAPGTRAALYHRVSTVDQDPAGARLELRRAAAARGLRVVLEIEETGSGTKNDRHGLQRLMAAVQAHQVDAVLVWKLDRFGRSCLDVLSNIKILENAGCRFISSTQGLDIQAGGDPMSRLIVNVLAALAEFERTLIAERTKASLQTKRERGIQLGRRPNEKPAALLERKKRVKKLRAAGMSWLAIAAELDCNVMQARIAGGYLRPAERPLSETGGSNRAGNLDERPAPSMACRKRTFLTRGRR